MVIQGLSSKEISKSCNISNSAVRYHIGKLFKEYQVNSTPKLIFAIQLKRSKSIDDVTQCDQVKDSLEQEPERIHYASEEG